MAAMGAGIAAAIIAENKSKDARTGQMQFTITAVNMPAIEATYKVKGVLVVEGTQSDVREFELRIRQ